MGTRIPAIKAGLVSALWPFATLYAFEYMTKETHENVFFLFYTLTYGVTLGIARNAKAAPPSE